MAKLGDLVVRIGADTRDLNKSLGKVQRNMRSMTSNFTALGTQMTKAITLPILGIGAMAIKSAADLEKMEVSFISLTGGAKQAADMMEQLNEFTAKTPFQIEAVATSARQLIASGTKISEVNEQLQFLGDIAATTGQPINEIAAIFAKVNAKGKVELENLNQLAERGIPIFKALSDATGLLPSELGAGAVSVEQFNATLKSFNEEGGMANGAMEQLSETATGKFSTALDNLKLAGAALAEDLLPAVNKILDSVIGLAQGFTELSDKTKKNILVIAGLVSTIGPLLIAIPRIISGIKLIGLAFATSMPQILAATVAISAISLLFLDTSREASNASKEIKKVETALKDLNKAQLEIEAQVSPGAAAEEIAESMEFAALRVQEADEEIKRIQQAIADRGGFVGVGARKQLNDIRAYKEEFERVINAAERLIQINDDTEEIKVVDRSQMKLLKALPTVLIGLEQPLKTLQQSTTTVADGIVKDLQSIIDAGWEFADQINEAIDTGVAAMIGGVALMVGAAIGAEKPLEGLGSFLGEMLAQMAINIGQYAIAHGTAIEAIKASLTSLSGIGAIVAGATLIALGAGLRSAIQKNAEAAGVPALAEGGLAYGPTLAMVGDNRGANIDPEVVAPLSKLKDMIGGNSIQVYGRISGDDIVISNNRATRDRNRF